MSLLLTSLIENITRDNVIIGILLAAVGLAVVFLAGKITKAIRGTKNIDKGDNIYVGLLTFALVCICIGLLMCIIRF